MLHVSRTSVLTASAIALAAGQAALADPGVGFLGAFNAAANAFPGETVHEIDLDYDVFDVELFAGSHLRDVDVAVTTGNILDVDFDDLDDDSIAIENAFTADALSWPDAIAIALDGPTGFSLDSLELDIIDANRLVFEAEYEGNDGSYRTIEFDAFTGAVVSDDGYDGGYDDGWDDGSDDGWDDGYDDGSDDGSTNPGSGPVDLLGAIDTAVNATGGTALSVEIDLEDGDRDYEVIVADTTNQITLEVEIEASTGIVDSIEEEGDPTWAEASAILALLPGATVDFAGAIQIAENETGGTAVEIELEIENGRLVYDVDLVTDSDSIDIDIDAVTGDVTSYDDSGSDGYDQPGTGPLALGVLDAINAAEGANPGFSAFEAELEFSGGVFEWEVELVNTNGTVVVEVDLSGSTGAILDADTYNDTDDAAEAAAFLAGAVLSPADATAAGISAVGGGFVYDLDFDLDGTSLIWEVGVIFNDLRWEAEINAVTGNVVEVYEEGPAHFSVDNSGDGAPLAISLASLTPGDTDDDDAVSVLDLSRVLSNFGQITPDGDVNFDGRVTALDLSVVLSNFGTVYTN